MQEAAGLALRYVTREEEMKPQFNVSSEEQGFLKSLARDFNDFTMGMYADYLGERDREEEALWRWLIGRKWGRSMNWWYGRSRYIGIPLSPFSTGSYTYGAPSNKSDFDIVVDGSAFSERDLLKIPNVKKTSIYPHSGNICYRIGIVNIISVEYERAYWGWYDATRECVGKKPISTEEAGSIFRRILGANEIYSWSDE